MHIQYKRRKLEGELDCQNREFQKKEKSLDEQILRLRKELATEKTVSAAISGHLYTRISTLKQEVTNLTTKEEDKKKEFEDKTNKIREE